MIVVIFVTTGDSREKNALLKNLDNVLQENTTEIYFPSYSFNKSATMHLGWIPYGPSVIFGKRGVLRSNPNFYRVLIAITRLETEFLWG